MELTILAFLNGFSALCLVLLGLFYCIRFMIYFIKQKKKMAPFMALLALSLGCMHLGGTVAFLVKLFWGQDLNIFISGFLTYIHIPLGLTLAIYLGYDIFNPKFKWWMVLIYTVLGIVYLTAMIGWPTVMISGTTPAPDEVIDININNVALAITIIYLITAVLVLGMNFLVLRTKMNNSESQLKKKSLLLGIGWILFGFAGMLCTINPLNITIIPHSIFFTALVLIFSGLSPLKTEPKEAEMEETEPEEAEMEEAEPKGAE